MSIPSPAAGSDPFRCVLVGIPSGRDWQTPALRHAIAFAGACHATLSLYVFAPRPWNPIPVNAADASAWLAEETARLEELTSSTLRSAVAAVSRAGLDVVAEHPGALFEAWPERFVRLARLQDLAILDAVDAGHPAQRRAIEDVLFDSGRPLLLVPRQGAVAMPRRIAIAWDGSARAARAVKDALPLLAGADQVVAVTVEGEKDLSRMAPGAELATYLARHGIGCKLATLAARTGDAAERLRIFVAEEEMEMIVMGAFVHSRFRQDILGGFTQSLLDQPPAALFLAH